MRINALSGVRQLLNFIFENIDNNKKKTLESIPFIELHTIKNSKKNILKYLKQTEYLFDLSQLTFVDYIVQHHHLIGRSEAQTQ